MKYFFAAFILLFLLISNSNSQSSWHTLPNAPVAESGVARFDDVYFINSLTGWIVEGTGSVYKTTDGGHNWVLTNDQIQQYIRSTGFFDENTGIIGTLFDSLHILYRTTDGGFTFTDITQSIHGTLPSGMCGISIVNSTTAYASGRYYCPANVIKTTNTGLNWVSVPVDTSLARSLIDCYFWTADSGFIVGGYSSVNDYSTGHSVILMTGNGGLNWSRVYYSSRINEWCWKINFVNSRLGFASIERDFGLTYYLKTTDGGLSWAEKPFIVYDVEGIGFLNENTGWIGGWGINPGPGPTYETTNAGASWHLAGWGINMNRIRFLSDTLAYAVGRTVYKYTSEPIGIVPISTEVPKQFSLQQNYPNPFNPTTVVKFQVASYRLVKLSIYDVLGKEVAILVNEKLNPGTYSVEWNASNYPSGVYFYRMTAGDPGAKSGTSFSESKKLILLK
jgi:photosystem II stability/assembly factor-like uncharacterized protein